MEDGFPMLDEFHDPQALERQLESLLDDASDHLPDLDTGVLGEGSHVSSAVDGLDVLGHDIFETPRTSSVSNYSLPSPGGPMLTQHVPPISYRPGSHQPPASPSTNVQSSSVPPSPHQVPPSPHQVPPSPHQVPPSPHQVPPSPHQVPPSPHQVPPSPHQVPPSPHQVPPSPHQMQSPGPSPAAHQFQSPSPAQPPSPATYLPMKSLPPPPSPANLPPPPSPANLPPPPSPAQVYYSKSPASAYVPPSSPQTSRPSTTPGPPVLSPQPASSQQQQQNSVFLAAPSSVISAGAASLVPGSGVASLAPSPGGGAASLVQSAASLVPGTVISGNQLNMQSLQLHAAGGTIVSGGQVFQIQLQPSANVHGVSSTAPISNKPQALAAQTTSVVGKGKQPQLLPKPSANGSQQSATTVRVSSAVASAPQTHNLTAVVSTASQQQQPIFINQGGVISSVQPGSTPIIMGQMVAPAGQTAAAAAAPMIIQQPSGGPMFVLRPNAPLPTAQTIAVPIAAAQPAGLAGQLILQQGQPPRGILAANQQVKLVSQNQIQMQQIQTPNGPKIIAVPIGQTLIPGQNLIATPSSAGGLQLTQPGIQLTANPAAAAVSQQPGSHQQQINLTTAPILTNTSQGFTLTNPTSQHQQQQPTLVSTLPLGMKTTSVLQHTSGGTVSTMVSSTQQSVVQVGPGTPGNPNTVIHQQKVVVDPLSLSPTKRKKSKKKKRDSEEEVVVHHQPKTGTVDLGALMKDVGLDLDDLDSFGMEQNNDNTSFHSSNLLNTSQESTSSSDQERSISNQYSINPAEIMQAPAQLTVAAAAAVSQPTQQQQQLTVAAAAAAAVSQPGTIITQPTQQQQMVSAAKPVIQPVPTQQISSRQVHQPQIVQSQVVTQPGGGSQPQVLTQPLTGSSFQLIQGPDGQFILQTSPATSSVVPSTTSASTEVLTPTLTLSEPASRTTQPIITQPPRASPSRTTTRSRQPADPNRTPLMEDETLPAGWHRKVSQRKSGASAGRYEVFIIGPSGKRFRSRNELKSFFEKTGETSLNPDDFDFSTFGRNNTKGGSSLAVHANSYAVPSSSVSNSSSSSSLQPPSTPPVSSSQQIVQPVQSGSLPPRTSTSSSSNQFNPETELIKKLEVTGMASVAAARALETGVTDFSPRNNLLKSIQQPLPQSALISPPALDLPRVPLALGTVPSSVAPVTVSPAASVEQLGGRVPPPHLDHQASGPPAASSVGAGQATSSVTVSPGLTVPSSPLEDADEQISKLLKTLHQQPVKPEEEMFDALTKNRRNLIQPTSRAVTIKSPEPPVITSVKSSVVKSSLFNENAPSPSMPVLLPQVPISESSGSTSASIKSGGGQDSGFQNSYLDSLAKSQIGDKRSRARTSSGPMNAGGGAAATPSPGSRMPLLSPSSGQDLGTSSSPAAAAAVSNLHKPATVIQETPRFESTSQGPPNVTIQTALPAPPGLGLGGAGSQIRAMQHAPPNTRLVRGPNGQVTLQKVQTIELSLEMQHTFKLVAQRISDIESKPVKTPQDEAELASLQAKQHQILSTGRPVSTHTPNSSMSSITAHSSSVSSILTHPSSIQSHISIQSQPTASLTSPVLTSSSLASTASAPGGKSRLLVRAGQQVIHPGAGGLSAHHPVGGGGVPVHHPAAGGPVSAHHPTEAIQPQKLGLQSVSTSIQPSPNQIFSQGIGMSSRPIAVQPTPPHTDPTKPSQISSFPPINVLSQKPPTAAAAAGRGGAAAPPQQSVIPPLTDAQKKIVAEFKARIANLPPDQQQAYIAQNKRNLLLKLDFQPSQLHVLQGGRPPGPAAATVVMPSAAAATVRTLASQPPSVHDQSPRHPVMHFPPAVIQPNLVPGGPLSSATGGVGVVRPPRLTAPNADMPVVLNAATTAAVGGVAAMDFPPRPVTLNPPPLPPPPPAISKAKKIAWVESQIKKDQHEAVNPNYSTPFWSKEDACKRLLRYHVFDEPSMSATEWIESEEEFERKSTQLLSKYHSMLSKYHILMLQESTRLCSSSEEVMLARHWEADERSALSREKEEYSRRLTRLSQLRSKPALHDDEIDEYETIQEKLEPSFPPIPASWEARYEQVVGKPYLPSKKEHAKQKVFRKSEKIVELTPIQDIEVKKDPDLSEMPILEDERLFCYKESTRLSSVRSRNSSQASLDSFRSRNDSGASSRKELRVSLTNVMSVPHLKKELLETGSIHSPSSRPQSADLSSSPEPASFVGLKFNRTTSGRWSASLKRDLDDGDHEGSVGTPSLDWKKSRMSPTFGSDSDEDFSLADVGGGAAVRSMLEQDDDDDDDDSRTEDFYGGGGGGGHGGSNLFGANQGSRGTPASEPGDSDSVQNAINSILDMPDRGGMQTPEDINNLTGLLDSMEDEEEQDPNLAAAVKSIQML